MARVILNPALQILSGDVAGFVYRQQADGSVVVARRPLPDPDWEPSDPQLAQMQRFKEASARYRRLLEDSDVAEAYETLLAERGPNGRLRALVMGDIMKAPKVSTIDLTNYHGNNGDTIRIFAEDNVAVSGLRLTIYDVTEGNEIEEADMEMNGRITSAVEWVYEATETIPSGHEVEVRVTAVDLAENRTELSMPLD